MKISNHIGKGRQRVGWPGYGRERWQWQPTTSAHDPNPPIILEDPAGGTTIVEADLASSGAGAGTFAAASIAASVASSAGTGTLAAAAAAIVQADASASGLGTLAAVGAAVAPSQAESSGLAAGGFAASALVGGELAAEGSSDAAFEGEDAAVPAGPSVDWQGGEADPRVGRKKRRRIEEDVRGWVDELYAELSGSDNPDPVREQAADIVRPFARSDDQVPAASSVDWVELAKEAARVRALLDLWTRQARARALDEDDEEIIEMEIW